MVVGLGEVEVLGDVIEVKVEVGTGSVLLEIVLGGGRVVTSSDIGFGFINDEIVGKFEDEEGVVMCGEGWHLDVLKGG